MLLMVGYALEDVFEGVELEGGEALVGELASLESSNLGC